MLGDIYLGKIAKWNDPAIKALNPGLALPDQMISVVRRADGSGTSFQLHQLPGQGPSRSGRPPWVRALPLPNWKVGVGGKGNEGVSAFVQRLQGSIGYVEYAYAKQNKMAFTQVKNKDGVFVSPDDATFKAAAANADWNKSFYQVLTNQPGKDSWPITAATFIMMHTAQDKPEQGAASLKFFDWAYLNGDKMATDLEYVPMPDSVKAIVRTKVWAMIKDGAGKSVYAK